MSNKNKNLSSGEQKRVMPSKLMPIKQSLENILNSGDLERIKRLRDSLNESERINQTYFKGIKETHSRKTFRLMAGYVNCRIQELGLELDSNSTSQEDNQNPPLLVL